MLSQYRHSSNQMNTTKPSNPHGRSHLDKTAAPGLHGQASFIFNHHITTTANTSKQEWRERLRSAIHPWVYAAVYRAADTLSKSLASKPAVHAGILIMAPKLAQAVFAATLDFYTWRLGRTVYGAGSAASLAAVRSILVNATD